MKVEYKLKTQTEYALAQEVVEMSSFDVEYTVRAYINEDTLIIERKDIWK